MRKLRTDGRPLCIEPRRAALETLARETEGLAAIYLFGSYGTADQTPLSDVDLGFVFRADAVPSSPEELDLLGNVLDALREEDVTIVVLNKADCLFQFEVLSTGRLLYCADEIALADFVEEVLRRHGDYVIDHERFLREYDEALVEQYGHG
jgi:predicted nucleotidyltransferase